MSHDHLNAIDATIAHIPSPGEQFFPPFAVTPELEAQVAELITHYPEGRQKSAILPILHIVQKQFGFINPASIEWTASQTGVSAAHVLGVVTFYPGLRQKCPGKFHFRICRTLSCAMSGAEDLFEVICRKTNIDPASINHHEPIGVSPCGMWSIEQVECLANCGNGPNVLVNDLLFDKVTPEKVDGIIAKYKQA